MKMRTLVISGVLGWFGGLATMIVSGSCDIIEEPEPNYPDDGVEPQFAEDFVARSRAMDPDDDERPLTSVDGQRCDLMARPSVYLGVAKQYDDSFQPVDVDAVWYEWRGRTFEATCVRESDGTCEAWIAGWERPGRIAISTEYCDTVVDVDVDVPMTEDGCHVETQYIIMPVKELGCLATEPEDPPDPDPHPRFG
jgi:hypothetical protein